MSVLEFRLLGPVEVLADGEPVPVRGEKPRAVLALLLLEAGRVVSTDRLIDCLWGERPPRTAATSLQNFVAQLRKLLGADLLETRPPGYRLRAEREQIDLGRFEQLVEQAHREEDAQARSETLARALSLWRGRPLAEFAFEPWAEGEGARLEDARLAAVERRIEADLQSGRHAELVGELESLVSVSPLRERLWGLLMQALYASGRQAEALDAYAKARRTLVAEVGMEPGPALQELQRRILRHEAPVPDARPSPDDHYDEVVRALLAGRLVPLLGTEVTEVAAHLARRFDYPSDGTPDLTRISQYVAVMEGAGPLYDELHELFSAEPEPSAVHRFLASLPPLLRGLGLPHQLIVTTGYDLALEGAFLAAGEEFDVVSYVAAGRNRGKFCHLPPGGGPTLIERPNTYATELSLDRRTVILRLHGGVDTTPERQWESFVVTEDDYIDYLTAADLSNVVPVALAAKLRRSHFLFLGYGMRDWNLRVILHRIWADQSVGYRGWAVQPEPSPLDCAFWRSRDVDVVAATLEEYVAGLERRVAAVGAVGAAGAAA